MINLPSEVIVIGTNLKGEHFASLLEVHGMRLNCDFQDPMAFETAGDISRFVKKETQTRAIYVVEGEVDKKFIRYLIDNNNCIGILKLNGSVRWRNIRGYKDVIDGVQQIKATTEDTVLVPATS